KAMHRVDDRAHDARLERLAPHVLPRAHRPAERTRGAHRERELIDELAHSPQAGRGTGGRRDQRYAALAQPASRLVHPGAHGAVLVDDRAVQVRHHRANHTAIVRSDRAVASARYTCGVKFGSFLMIAKTPPCGSLRYANRPAGEFSRIISVPPSWTAW